MSRSAARSRRRAAALALALPLGAALAHPAAAAAQRDPPSLNAGRVAGQVATGVLGTPVGFVAGGLATRTIARSLGAGEERASSIAMVGAWTGSALLTAAGPTLVGASQPHVRGSYPAALAGAVAGGVGSWLLVRLNTRSAEDDGACHVRCVLSTVAIFTLPSIGATIGFNLSRKYD
jgi:hypothetical protein